jgi:hypothetical protein
MCWMTLILALSASIVSAKSITQNLGLAPSNRDAAPKIQAIVRKPSGARKFWQRHGDGNEPGNDICAPIDGRI